MLPRKRPAAVSCEQEKVSFNFYLDNLDTSLSLREFFRGESLQLARKMVNVANFQLADVIQNLERKKHKWVLKPQYGGCPVAVEAAKYHLKLTEWDKDAPKEVREVMHKTAIGLNKCITFTRPLTSSLAPMMPPTATRGNFIHILAHGRGPIMPIATLTWYSLLTIIN